MPRSGTTLLRRILDGHPAICAPGETFLFRAASRFLESEEIAFGIDYGVFGGLKPLGFSDERILDDVRRLAFGFHEELAQRAGKRRWAAKTAVDSFYAAAIERLCAGHARFVCVLRHGMDVVCSLKEFSDELQGYIAELRPYVQRYPRPLEAFAHAWVDVTASLLALVERNPEGAIALRYEDLVASPEATLSRLFAFLGENWDDGLLRQAFENREVAGLGDWQEAEHAASHEQQAEDGAKAGWHPAVAPFNGAPHGAGEAFRERAHGCSSVVRLSPRGFCAESLIPGIAQKITAKKATIPN
jgi:hypothetical protein